MKLNQCQWFLVLSSCQRKTLSVRRFSLNSFLTLDLNNSDVLHVVITILVFSRENNNLVISSDYQNNPLPMALAAFIAVFHIVCPQILGQLGTMS